MRSSLKLRKLHLDKQANSIPSIVIIIMAPYLEAACKCIAYWNTIAIFCKLLHACLGVQSLKIFTVSKKQSPVSVHEFDN